MEIKIINGSNTTTMYFNEEDGTEMIEAINNCINHPTVYVSIKYGDKKDNIIFPSEYLKRSMIVIPK